MGSRDHIRVDPEGDIGADAQRMGDGGESIHLRLRLDIELPNAKAQRFGHFGAGFANA